MDTSSPPRSGALPCVLAVVAAGGPMWGWTPCLQILWAAVLNLGTFFFQHPKSGACALPQIALADPSRSASPDDQYYI